jgi:hypothetical protein
MYEAVATSIQLLCLTYECTSGEISCTNSTVGALVLGAVPRIGFSEAEVTASGRPSCRREQGDAHDGRRWSLIKPAAERPATM